MHPSSCDRACTGYWVLVLAGPSLGCGDCLSSGCCKSLCAGWGGVEGLPSSIFNRLITNFEIFMNKCEYAYKVQKVHVATAALRHLNGPVTRGVAEAVFG